MFVTSLEHSGMLVEDEGVELIIDPWPQSEETERLAREAGPELILLTHGHFDHLGIAVELATSREIPIVAVPELAAYCRGLGASAELINFGGTFDGGACSVKCVPALHSSSAGDERVYAGNPCGFVISMGSGTLYHAGDTCLFSDMKLIGDSDLDVAALPIGGRTTMDPSDALRAIPLLQPKYVIPIHVNTWDFIQQDVDGFCEAVERTTGASALKLEPAVRTSVLEEGDDPGGRRQR